MRLVAVFRKGFTKAAMQSGFTPGEAQMLISKIGSPAEIAKDVGSKALNWGVPAAVGGLGAYEAHQHGADPLMTGTVGVGSALMASPRRYKQLIEESRLAPDPLTHFGWNWIGDAGKKAGTVAGIAAADKGKEILDNMAKTTGNTAQITGNFATNAPALSANLSKTIEGTSQFWDPKSGQANKLVGTMQDVGNTMKTELPKLTGAATETAGQLNSTLGTIKDKGFPINVNVGGLDNLKQEVGTGLHNVGDRIGAAYQGLSHNQRVGLGAGAAGVGGLALYNMLKGQKKPRRIIEY